MTTWLVWLQDSVLDIVVPANCTVKLGHAVATVPFPESKVPVTVLAGSASVPFESIIPKGITVESAVEVRAIGFDPGALVVQTPVPAYLNRLNFPVESTLPVHGWVPVQTWL